MKKSFLSLLLLSFACFLFGQEEKETATLFYDLHSIDLRAISQGDLRDAKTLSDIDDRYPAEWVKEYHSVEIITTCDGIEKRIKGKSDQLNAEQRKALSQADYGTMVGAVIKYMPDNSLSSNTEQTLNFSMSILPENEASFKGGKEALIQYLKIHIEDKIPSTIAPIDIKWMAVRFNVNEEGSITQLQSFDSTGYEDVDQIIQDAICNMPQWSPAVDSKSNNVVQELEFVIGNTRTMCNLNWYFMNKEFLKNLDN